MSWAKLDDALMDHPKIIGLSDVAFRSYVRGICYSARYLTNGNLSHATIRGWRGRAELLSAGLWDQTPTGYLVHDFLVYNPSREQVENERRTARERRAKDGRTSADVRVNVGRTQSTPSRPLVVQDQELPAEPGDRSNITPDQTYLVRKLQERGEGWHGLAWSGIGKLNNDFGPRTVTEALRRMTEEDTVPAASFPLLRSVCSSLATREAAAKEGA